MICVSITITMNDIMIIVVAVGLNFPLDGGHVEAVASLVGLLKYDSYDSWKYGDIMFSC